MSLAVIGEFLSRNAMVRRVLKGIIAFVVLTFGWQVLADTVNTSITLIPWPLQVWDGFVELVDLGVLQDGIRDSLYRFALGYVAAALCGAILGFILGCFHGVWEFVDPIVQVLRPISPVAWLPFLMIWGIGDFPAVVVVFIAGFFPILLSTVSAVGRVDATYLKVAQNFGLSRLQRVLKVILPASFPQITTGLHLAVATCWVFLVVGEYAGAQTGLGYLITDTRNNVRYDQLVAVMIMIGLLGLLIDRLIGMGEKAILRRWGVTTDGEVA